MDQHFYILTSDLSFSYKNKIKSRIENVKSLKVREIDILAISPMDWNFLEITTQKYHNYHKTLKSEVRTQKSNSIEDKNEKQQIKNNQWNTRV